MISEKPGAAEHALEEAIHRYSKRNPSSAARYEKATAFMPGGNTRTVLYAAPFPLTFVKGSGARLWSMDGDEYVDFLGEFTAGLYGHSEPIIRAAIIKALQEGISFGGHNVYEASLSELICARFPSMERVRFTNSGTEANYLAIAAAIAITGRHKVLVFEGGYHGAAFVFSGPRAPLNAPFDFIVAPYNDNQAAADLIRIHRSDLAAVVIEPMLGSGGCIPAEPAFLQLLRAETQACGAFLIFDEVMTSRLSSGGLQAVLKVTPDITTLGKYIGGGMSFGAFGGRQDIMSRFDPRTQNALMHAGTFNNNVLSMAAGIAGLTQVYTPAAAISFNQRGDALRARLNRLTQQHDVRMQFTGVGSLMAVHMQPGKIACYADIEHTPTLRDLFFFHLLEAGIWIAKRGMIVMSLPLTDADLDLLESAVERFVISHRSLLR
jgi:glutamate-1-semialdehyde 2,1-aminomutase